MAGHEDSHNEKSSNPSSNSNTANNNNNLSKHAYNPTVTKPALPRTAVPENALTTTPPSLHLLEARQNNPQDCQNLITASVNRATVEISRTIIALNATFSQQLQAASQSASNGIRSAQESANSSIKVVVQSASVATVAAFSSVTVANRQVTSANLALTDAQASASAALSSANQSLAIASQSLVGVNSALGDARGNVSSLSLVSLSISSASLSVSSGSASVSSASSSEVVRLSASLTMLAASVSSIQASAFLAIAAAQSALASVTGSAAAQASAILASAASATRIQGGPQTVFVGSPSMDGQPVVLKSPKILAPLQIAVIVIGSVVVLLLLIVVVFFLIVRARRRKKRDVPLDEKTLPSSPTMSLPRLNSTTKSENKRTRKFNPPKSSESPRPNRSALKSQGAIPIARDSIPPNVPEVPEVPKIDAQVIPAHISLASDFKLEIWPVNFDLLTPEVDYFPATPGLIEPIIPLPIDKSLQADADDKAHDTDLLVQSTPNFTSKNEKAEEVVLNPFEDPVEVVIGKPPPSTSISVNHAIVLSIASIQPLTNTIIDPNPFADPIAQEPEYRAVTVVDSEKGGGEEEEKEEEEEPQPSPSVDSSINTTIRIPSQEISETEILIQPLFWIETTKVTVPAPSTGEEVPSQDSEPENAIQSVPSIELTTKSEPYESETVAEAKAERTISPLRRNPQIRNVASLLLENPATENLPQVAESLNSLQDPETKNANDALPSSDLSQTQELPDAKAERTMSPLRRNPQIRNVASLLLESTATENLPEVTEPPAEESEKEEPEPRGRSMIRTSDIISARLSQIIHIKNQTPQAELEAPSSNEKAISPLPRIEVENIKVSTDIGERTRSPLQRNPSLYVRSVKRKSRTLSPRKPIESSLSLRDRTESPLRRNPVDLTSVAKFRVGNTALLDARTPIPIPTPITLISPPSPSSPSPSTSAIKTPQPLIPPLPPLPTLPTLPTPTPTPVALKPNPNPTPAPNPLLKRRSRSAPRPASNAAFAQTLSRFRDLAAREQIQAKQASSEVTQRARAGIFIPGSLREQAVRNLSRSREQEKGGK